MKRFFSAVTAFILIAAIVFSFSACKDNNGPAEKPADIRLIYEDIVADDVLLETFAGDESRYRKIIVDDFGYGESGADKFYENYADYYLYGITLKILNYTDSSLVLKSIESDSNGKNGIYIRKSFNGGENGIDARMPESDYFADAITLHVLNENIELSDEQVVATVKSMNLTVTYSDGASEKNFRLKVEDNVEITQAQTGDSVIKLNGSEFGIEDKLRETYSDENTYKDAIVNGFGLGEKGAEKFFDAPQNYQFFSYNVNIENVSEHDIIVYGIEPADNGNDGVYARVTFNGEMGIPAKDPNAGYVIPPFVIHILNTDPELLDDQVLGKVNEMSFNVTYAEKTVNGNSDSEEVGEQKTIKVKIY